MERGNLDAAIEDFERSHAMAPSSGAALTLAICHERAGRLASARARYRDAIGFARKEGDDKRVAYAKNQLEVLEPSVPKLIIYTSSVAAYDALTVEYAGPGAPPQLASLDTPFPVDPGTYTVTAKVPGHRAFSVEVTVDRGGSQTIWLPALEPEDTRDRSAVPSSRDEADEADEADDGGHGDPGRTAPGPADAPYSTRRILGWATVGAGAASAVTGLGFGWSAISTWDEAIDTGMCDPGTGICSEEGQRRTDKARFRANLADALVGAGLAVAAFGTWLILTAPDSEPATRVVPTVGPDRAVGVTVLGRF